MAKKMHTMSVYEPTFKRTSIGRGRVKTSTMNNIKEEVGRSIVDKDNGNHITSNKICRCNQNREWT